MRRFIFDLHLISSVFLFSISFASVASEPTWLVGVAKEDITPDFPVWLAGYDRPTPNTGIHDPVWARALSVANGRSTVVLLSADLIGLFKNDADDIRRRVAAFGVPFENIIVTATHNHNGPDVLGLWNADKSKTGVDSGYLAFAKRALVSVAKSALDNAKQADLFLAKTTVEGISYNGRDADITDNSVALMEAEDKNGESIATLVNFACHPEVLAEKNNSITSDFAHYLYERLEKQHGGTVLFINGALGGMLTPLVKEHSFQEAERCGNTLAESVLAALKRKVKIEDPTLLSRQKELELKLTNTGFEALYAKKILHREFKYNRVITNVGVIKIGPLTVATIPGEALPKIGWAIKEKMPGEFKMIFGLANDELGYLIPGEDWNPDAYEESMSIGPKAGDDVKDGIFSLLKGIEK